ncbi:MAG: SulP family inorganic anion transporter [Leptospiraceae bacterium]|nr:SulP family inorganic anion transporter [Leptospiraceae bacterium]MCP5512007.1 SulP family inorganic anion transporter [Leptospiraceae bacterium]
MSEITIPKDYLEGLKENWKTDILSGFTIFLIAMPLCIGIAIASGAPPLAGILSGIVGGIIASLISGSYVTINGPAAGLIVAVLSSIESLGEGDRILGFQYTLAVIFVSGILQMIMGYFRLGKFAILFPTTVIHGMLAGIGLIIIAKQIHIALGVVPIGKSVIDLILEIPSSLINMNPYVSFIGITSIVLMLLYPKLKWKFTKKIPAPLILVILSISIEMYFNFAQEHTYTFWGKEYSVSSLYLVSLPSDLFSGLMHPDFSKTLTGQFGIEVFAITMIGSLESLLTANAVDKLDPYKRTTDMNRDLMAKGFSNSILGLIGGIPIIAEVVRSSANIDNGAKTRWSNFFHGLFLLLAVIFIKDIIEKVPLSALSGMLVVVGLRLAIPEFLKTIKTGFDQFLIFIVTVYFTISHDLLVGVGIGILVKGLIHFINVILPDGITINDFARPAYKKSEKEEDGKKEVIFQFHGILIFLNYFFLKMELDSISEDSKIILDFNKLRLVDLTVMENLHDFERIHKNKGGEFEIRGLENSRTLAGGMLSGRKIEHS